MALSNLDLTLFTGNFTLYSKQCAVGFEIGEESE